jgi:hypothetical protein
MWRPRTLLLPPQLRHKGDGRRHCRSAARPLPGLGVRATAASGRCKRPPTTAGRLDLPKQFAACRLVSLRTRVRAVRHMGSEIIDVVERRRCLRAEVMLRILDEVAAAGRLRVGCCRPTWRCARPPISGGGQGQVAPGIERFRDRVLPAGHSICQGFAHTLI